MIFEFAPLLLNLSVYSLFAFESVIFFSVTFYFYLFSKIVFLEIFMWLPHPPVSYFPFQSIETTKLFFWNVVGTDMVDFSKNLIWSNRYCTCRDVIKPFKNHWLTISVFRYIKSDDPIRMFTIEVKIEILY